MKNQVKTLLLVSIIMLVFSNAYARNFKFNIENPRHLEDWNVSDVEFSYKVGKDPMILKRRIATKFFKTLPVEIRNATDKETISVRIDEFRGQEPVSGKKFWFHFEPALSFSADIKDGDTFVIPREGSVRGRKK